MTQEMMMMKKMVSPPISLGLKNKTTGGISVGGGHLTRELQWKDHQTTPSLTTMTPMIGTEDHKGIGDKEDIQDALGLPVFLDPLDHLGQQDHLHPPAWERIPC